MSFWSHTSRVHAFIACWLLGLSGCEGQLEQVDATSAPEGGAADAELDTSKTRDSEPEASVCPNGLTDCGFGTSTQCLDLQTAWDHCGSCTSVCEAGQACVDGACACEAGLTDCKGDCVDLETDKENCGACGGECSPGVCENGVCQCNCDPGYTVCSSSSGCVCVDTRVSAEHCGGCFERCEWHQPCIDGVCRCPDEQVVCKDGCTDIVSDSEACGACANACAEGSSCESGACSCPCWPGETCCDDRCHALDSDPAHCGACDHPCAAGEHCLDGVCVSYTTCCEFGQNPDHELGTGLQSNWLAWEIFPLCNLEAASISLALPYGAAAILADDDQAPGALRGRLDDRELHASRLPRRRTTLLARVS